MTCFIKSGTIGEVPKAYPLIVFISKKNYHQNLHVSHHKKKWEIVEPKCFE